MCVCGCVVCVVCVCVCVCGVCIVCVCVCVCIACAPVCMLQVVDFTDRINFYVMDAVSFFRNPSPNLRGNASLLVGALAVP